MPHLILDGEVDLRRVSELVPRDAIRWRSSVLKSDEVWVRADGRALLVEGVVVEHARPLHPVAVVSSQDGATSVRMWPRSEVERTPAVQHWLGRLAEAAVRAGCRGVRTTNLPDDVVADLDLTP
jgi:hypothetical protein